MNLNYECDPINFVGFVYFASIVVSAFLVIFGIISLIEHHKVKRSIILWSIVPFIWIVLLKFIYSHTDITEVQDKLYIVNGIPCICHNNSLKQLNLRRQFDENTKIIKKTTVNHYRFLGQTKEIEWNQVSEDLK